MKQNFKLVGSMAVIFFTLPIITVLTGLITEPNTVFVMVGVAGLLGLLVLDAVALVTIFDFVHKKLSPTKKESKETENANA